MYFWCFCKVKKRNKIIQNMLCSLFISPTKEADIILLATATQKTSPQSYSRYIIVGYSQSENKPPILKQIGVWKDNVLPQILTREL